MHAIVVVFLTGITFTLAASNYKFPLDSPNYEFGYQVFDSVKGQDFGHSERRNSDRTDGTYYVLLPDGRKQTVKYYADGNGYFPIVTYEQVSIPSTRDPGLIFHPEGNIFRKFNSEGEYYSQEITNNNNNFERSGFNYMSLEGVVPLESSVGVSTSNFDFHKDRKIDFVGSDASNNNNNNKNSNSFREFPLKLPVAFTKFSMSGLNTNKQRFDANKKDLNPYVRPSLKDSFEDNFDIFGRPLKSVDHPMKVVYNPDIGISNAGFKEDNVFANQLRQEPLIIKESEKSVESKALNPTDLILTSIYIPNNENSVSGYFKPLVKDMKIKRQFSRIFRPSKIREISKEEDTGTPERSLDETVVPALVPVPYPVEGPGENFIQYSDDGSDNNLGDYWDEDYL